MNTFKEILELAKNLNKINIAVINPIDNESLAGALSCAKENIANPILFGNKDTISSVARGLGEDYIDLLKNIEIVNLNTYEEILSTAVKYINNNQCSALMKGKIHTDEFMGAIVKKENGLRLDKQISHIFAVKIPTYHKILYITDGGINISPSLEAKEKIIYNAINFVKKLGITKPNIALMSATESVLPKMLSSVDANSIIQSKVFENISNIEGPLAFDNIISKKAALIKNIQSNIAGDVDIIIVPNIETGNSLVKSLVYLANADVAGVVVGAKVPIVLTSRADNAMSRLLSCALANIDANIK
jgi:phosphate acetyltransferase